MFTIDNKWATILSDFCLDIAKAYFIASFISPTISIYIQSPTEFLFLLTKGMVNVTMFLGFSRYLLQVKN